MRNSLLRIAFRPLLVSSPPDRQVFRVKTAVRSSLNLEVSASDGDIHDRRNSSANITPINLGRNDCFFSEILFIFS